MHTHFRIPICGYLYALCQPNVTLQRLKEADVLIIDEMSMMTNNTLNAIYSRVKQSLSGANDPFESKLLLLVGDMAQLPSICHHSVEDLESICELCFLQNSPFWLTGKHWKLTASICHSKDPLYLEFLNIIRDRKPTKEEINYYLH